MRFREIFEDPEWDWTPGWINIKTGKWVESSPKFSHVLYVVRYPEQFGISLHDLDDLPSIKYAYASQDFESLDGNHDILKFMSDLGWVRIILEDNGVINIQAGSVPEAHRAFLALLKQGIHCQCLYFDTPSESTNNLEDDNLERFRKTGRIPKTVQTYSRKNAHAY